VSPLCVFCKFCVPSCADDGGDDAAGADDEGTDEAVWLQRQAPILQPPYHPRGDLIGIYRHACILTAFCS